MIETGLEHSTQPVEEAAKANINELTRGNEPYASIILSYSGKE